MTTIRRSFLPVAVLLGLAAVPAFPAYKKSFDSRWKQAEENVRSAAGQPYFDDVFFKEFSGKYAVHMTECAQSTGERMLTDLTAVIDLGKEGQVLGILVRPETKPSKCFADLVKRDTFSPPPSAPFSIPVTIKFTVEH
jgi:hypothetical protein